MKIKKTFLSEPLLKLQNELFIEVKNDAAFMKEIVLPNDFDDAIIKDYIGQFISAKEEFNNCKQCKSLRECKNSNEGMCLTLLKDDSYVTRKYRPCSYYIRELNREKNILIKDFPPELDDINLENLNDFDDENRRDAITYMKQLINEKMNKWLFLCGAPKSDKTTFAIALLNTLVDEYKKTAAFVEMPKLLRELTGIVFEDKNKFNKIFNDLSSVDVLVLDDFGSGYINNVVRESFLVPLINSRFREGKMIIFTSRISIKESCAAMFQIKNEKEENPQFTLFHDVVRGNSKRLSLNHLIL